MSTIYWLAKYVEEPLRNEPRNVGVIVEKDGVLAARFIGERDDLVFDARKLGAKFSHPNVYTQWRHYWRGQIGKHDLPAVLKASTSNYFVQSGGEVGDAGGDAAAEVCQFLFDLLVGGGPLDAYHWQTEDETVALASEIVGAFDHLGILAHDGQLFTPHPILRERPVTGHHVTHTPSFSQRNGKLYLFDHIDLSGTRPTKINERAGFLGYMFSDIRARESDVEAYSIVRPSDDDDTPDPISYARDVLGSESTIVNWSDDREKQAFLMERRRVAEAA
jgi:hypothetical protein